MAWARRFEQANCIRAMLGETEDAGDSVLQLEAMWMI